MRFCFAGTLVTALFMALFVACGDGAADGGTSCGFETQAAECRRLCDNACTRTARCGLDQATCTTDCVRAYSCPAETPGQDDAICRLELARLPALCADLCVWTATFGVRPRDSGVMCSARAWQSFAITEGGNRPRSWLVLADGSFTSSKQGQPGSGALLGGDITALDALISSPAFQDGMLSGFSCSPAPPDVTVRFDLETDTGRLTADVSGCVLVGPDGNQPQAAHRIVSLY